MAVIHTNRKFSHTLLNKYWRRYLKNIFVWRNAKLLAYQGALASLPACPVSTLTAGLYPGHVSRFNTSLRWWKIFSVSTLPVRGGLISLALRSHSCWSDFNLHSQLWFPLSSSRDTSDRQTSPVLVPEPSPVPSDSCALAPRPFLPDTPLTLLFYLHAPLFQSSHQVQFLSGSL